MYTSRPAVGGSRWTLCGLLRSYILLPARQINVATLLQVCVLARPTPLRRWLSGRRENHDSMTVSRVLLPLGIPSTRVCVTVWIAIFFGEAFLCVHKIDQLLCRLVMDNHMWIATVHIQR